MRSASLILIIVLFVHMFSSANCTVYAEEYTPPVIRVAVFKNITSTTLAVKGDYKILSLYTRELLSEGNNLRMTTISPTVSGLLIGEQPFKLVGVKIEPARDASIIINKRRFRGSVDIIRTQQTRLLLVNYVTIENYLYGVLYHEVSPRWTMEALKTQAIVARTFALHQIRQRRHKDYDVTSDVYSQMYGGRTSERWRTTRAVNQTRGKVLTYRGRVFPAYYHATCGGHTEPASRHWKITIKPLQGIPCPYCERSPHYHWKRKISIDKIEQRLSANGYEIAGLVSIDTDDRYASGKIRNVVVRGNTRSITMSAYQFRLIVGPNVVRSHNFDVTIHRDAAWFEGYGWGHGVGLCQWGAYLMSKRDRRVKAKDILEFYYPGAVIKHLSEIDY
jgi:stage II sporulation protein D